jgi:hypothetical protein
MSVACRWDGEHTAAGSAGSHLLARYKMLTVFLPPRLSPHHPLSFSFYHLPPPVSTWPAAVTMAPTSKTRAGRTTSLPRARKNSNKSSNNTRGRKKRSIRPGTCANCGCTEVSADIRGVRRRSVHAPPVPVHPTHPQPRPPPSHHTPDHPSSTTTHTRPTPTSGAATATARPPRATATGPCCATPAGSG